MKKDTTNDTPITTNDTPAPVTAPEKNDEKKEGITMENTVTVTREFLIETARKAARELDETKAKAKETTWATGLDVSKALTDALTAVNDNMLTTMYDGFLSTPAPVTALCKCATWSRKYARENRKEKRTDLVDRDTRLDLLNFIEYAGDKLSNGPALSDAITATADKLADYVIKSMTADAAPSVRDAKNALESLLRLLDVEGVHARSVDIRFIVYASTRARKLGELAEITGKSIVPYIMDVVTVQLRGIEYKFESKEEAAE